MIFLKLNILIAVIFLVLHILSAIDIAYEFKRLHPNMKVRKSNWADCVLTFIKSIITACIPILNIILCLVYLFKYEELKNKAIDKVYTNCVAEKKKELKQNVTHLSETSGGE